MPDSVLALLTCLMLLPSLEEKGGNEKALHRVGRQAERVFIVLCALLLLSQLLFRPFAWQVWPLILVAVVRVAVMVRGGTSGRGLRVAGVAGGGLMVAVSLLLMWALPIPTLPKTQPLGTFTKIIDQPERSAVYGETPDAHRRFPVQVWYPAKVNGHARRAAWLPELSLVAPILGRPVGLPAFLMRHLEYVESNAVEGADATAHDAAGYPVVIYSHGWTGFRTVAITEIEALADAGYVVIAPDHTYGALFTVLDGEVVPNNPKAMPPKQPADEYQVGIERLVDTYADDLRACLDFAADLQSGARPSPLTGTLDLSRIGLFGHSTGGGAVVEVAKTEDRVQAALGLDPWVEPVSPMLRAQGRDIPFASIRSGEWYTGRDANNGILATVLPTFGAYTYDLYVPDTTHTDFTLMPLLSPLMPKLGMTGPLDPKRSLETVDQALCAFFDAFLKAAGSPEQFEALVDGRYLVSADPKGDSGRVETAVWRTIPADSSSPFWARPLSAPQPAWADLS